jgi:hypothetical protein
MFKLLPYNEQKRLSANYRLRVLTVALFALCAIEVIGAVSLLPAHFWSGIKGKNIETQHSAVAAELTSVHDSTLSGQFKASKRQLSILGQSSGIPISMVVKTIVATKVSGVSITRITVKEEKTNLFDTTITGIASSRDSLVSFKKSLERETRLSGVALPVSDLARNKDIPFTIHIKAQF